MIEIKGIIPAVITPMHDDESINFEELKNQIARQIRAGVHGIFVLGTNGENYILSENEKIEIMKIAVEVAKGIVPVYAGTGCVGTEDTIRLSKIAESLGVDALSIICPYFAAISQEEIYAHYKEVAESVNIPIVIYNIPARTGANIAPNTIRDLSEIPNIVGVKDSSGNFDNMLQYIELTRNRDFAVLSGNDSLILWNLLAGGVGGVAGCANVYPETLVGIYEAFQSKDLLKARAYQDSLRGIRGTFKYGNPNTIVKYAVRSLGYPVGDCRKPFNRISQEAKNAIGIVLDNDRERGIR